MQNPKTRKLSRISILWGFSEATWFFIVPDVWLSFCSIESLSKGMKQFAYTIAAALLGGTVMFILGRSFGLSVASSLDYVPAISQDVINYTFNDLMIFKYQAIVNGPFQGIPYKIYAAYCGALPFKYWMFIWMSVPARGIRFMMSILLSNFVFNVILKKWSLRKKRIALALTWSVIYIFYFYTINQLSCDFII